MKKIQYIVRTLAGLFLLAMMGACSGDKGKDIPPPPAPVVWESISAQPDAWDNVKRGNIAYQVLVYSFADADGNKWGDLRGVAEKLDYIQSLGVQAIWLSPIHPSPSYHGYDVTSYDQVDPRLGTMADFDYLVAEAKKRGIKIYLDYVLNHTSTSHPWFKEAVASATSPYRAYYSFSENPAEDIKAGKVPMIATEGSGGYRTNEWYEYVNEANAVQGVLKFTLDWSNAQAPVITVTKAATPDADNPDTSTAGAKFLYFGDGVTKKFYAKGNNKYELTVDFHSTWGFLVRTSSTAWDGGTKYGAGKGQKLALGTPFTLTNAGDPSNIVFNTMQSVYYHSNFNTGSFADLNYGTVANVTASPVFSSVVASAHKWIDHGVEGFRLDAVKHIYHNETSDENPRFLRSFYDAVNTHYKAKSGGKNLYMVGEVLSDHQTVTPYYKGLPAYFEFAFWYRLEWAINNGQGFTFAKDLVGYRAAYAAQRPDYIAATKLTNHDEDRAATKLGQNTDKMKLAAAVLLTASGQPYIYYGEELGLHGQKEGRGDEWVRSSMPWEDRYTTDLSSVYGDKIDKGMLNTLTVKKQEADRVSMLQTYRNFTRLRNTYPALAEGEMSKHSVYNDQNTHYSSLAAWYMTKGAQKVLVFHNFGASSIEFVLTDVVKKAIAIQGTAESRIIDGKTYLRLGKYSTLVYLL